MEEESREEKFKKAIEIHNEFGVSKEYMANFLKTYNPATEIYIACEGCQRETRHHYVTRSIDNMTNPRFFSRNQETRLIYLTYECPECKTSSTFLEKSTKIEKRKNPRNQGLIGKILDRDKAEKSLSGEYS